MSKQFKKFAKYTILLVIVGYPVLFSTSPLFLSYVYNIKVVNFFAIKGITLCPVEGISYIIFALVPVFILLDLVTRTIKKRMGRKRKSKFDNEYNRFEKMVAIAAQSSEYGLPVQITKVLAKDYVIYPIFLALLLFALFRTATSC